MDETRLDAFSRGFAAVLFAAYPDWRGYARVEGRDEEDGGHLFVEVPCPNSAVFVGVMQVDTEGEEVTVAFDAFHTHFPMFSSDDPAGDYAEASELIGEFVSERTKVVSWWSGETWKGSTRLPADEAVATPHWVTDSETVRVRSWLGTYDEDGPAG